MPSLPVTDRAYGKLVVSLHATLTQGLADARKALEYQRLKTYWTVGCRINDYLDAYQQDLKTHQAFYSKLSRDIQKQTGDEIAYDTLRRAVQFCREYPRFPKKTPLTFTHYLALLRISDERQRARLENKAVKNDMTVTQIKQEIALLAGAGSRSLPLPKTQVLTVERGEPYVYYIQAQEDLAGRRVLRIDCGFKIQKSMPAGNARIKEGRRVVRAVKTEKGYSLRVCQKLRAKRYTYAGVVTKVVDGDTFDAHVDVGFGIWITDRFRLRGINAPEMGTAGGQRARIFLERYFLSRPLIIIRSVKEGVYGRWLADVFSLKGTRDPLKIAQKGEYLNQLLLDKGMAGVYR